MDVAAKDANQAAMTNHGQCCCAGTRTFVHESVYEEFLKKTKVAAEVRTVGDPFNKDTVQGPQVGTMPVYVCQYNTNSFNSDR